MRRRGNTPPGGIGMAEEKTIVIFNDDSKYEAWDLVTKEGFTPENLARHAKSIPAGAPCECVMGGWC